MISENPGFKDERGARLGVVAIGASAGGLEALSLAVRSLPGDLGCAYIVAQHVSPSHRSMMSEILGRETVLPVTEAVDGVRPLRDHIYVVPPGHNLVFRDGCFRLQVPSAEVFPKPSVNLLFQSLAESFDERAIGVVLSGTGADGTVGLRAIKAAGGMTFAQRPEQAKYDGMPRSAIEAGVVDHVVKADQLGFELLRMLRNPVLERQVDEWSAGSAELSDLFERVRRRSKIDFSGYKLATLLRRLQRRLIATRCDDLPAYLAHVEAFPDELDALAREALISVTAFFRDRDAFAALERQVREICANRSPDAEVRVWSVGCATGEEAYSLAMLFAEHAGDRLLKGRLQIFATDIDNDALAVARTGRYSAAALAELPRNYLDQYFQPCEGGYEPVKALRDCVVFARQDIATDPPFLRIDLVACRNVLIYFDTALQAKVLSVLHYALRSDGILFLGRSETASQQEDLFVAVDRRSRIYRPRGESRPQLGAGRVLRGKLSGGVTPGTVRLEMSHERHFLHAIVRHFASTALLIDTNARILHSHGAVNRFLSFPAGTPELNFATLVVPEFRHDALSALHRARRTGECARGPARRIASLGGESWRISVFPAAGGVEHDTFVVLFEQPAPGGETAPGVPVPAEAVDQTESASEAETELLSAREHLQTMLEEMAASNEELQALSEEVQAANEESLIKSAELAAINADFESVYNTLDFPVLVFDAELRAKRANAVAARLFDLPPVVGGQPFSRLHLPPPLAGLEPRLIKVLDTQRREQFVSEHDGRSWQIYLKPATNSAGVSQSVIVVAIDQTDLIRANENVRASQQQLLAIMNHSNVLFALKDPAGRYLFVNQRFVDFFELAGTAVVGQSDHQLFARETARMLRRPDLEVMDKLEDVTHTEVYSLHEKRKVLNSVRFPVFDANGNLSAVCMQAYDVTRSMHAEEQLRLAAKVFDRAGEAIFITDAETRIITANEAFVAITGYALEEAVGNTPAMLKSGRHGKSFYDEMWRKLREEGGWQGEIFNRRKDGEVYPEWLTINAVRDASDTVQHYVAIFSDISAIKSSQRKMEYLASHDSLTGLPNRGLLMDRLKHAILGARRKGHRLALMFIDLDNFKTINDSLGHDVGDLLLKEAAERLQKCVRDADTLARLGGDEFVALLHDIQVDDVNRIAGRIIDYLSASFSVRGHTLFVSASVGISLYPDDGDDSTALLKNADLAMYRAKEHGRNQYHFFAEEMKILALQRLTLETGLRQAIDASLFRVVFQPQVTLVESRIFGAEALLRWKDPALGEVSPAQFIPAAERSGLIGQVGEIALRLTLAHVAEWRSAGLKVPRISVNVSGHQLRDKAFPARVESLLDAYKVPWDALCIEVTESVFLEAAAQVGEVLRGFERLGATISIDDFGTGYSSLAYLKRMPIHELKIDATFVDGVDQAGDDAEISVAIIGLARALGMQVIAEGGESRGQAEFLQARGCQYAQGYLFHRPLEAPVFAKLLSNGESG